MAALIKMKISQYSCNTYFTNLDTDHCFGILGTYFSFSSTTTIRWWFRLNHTRQAMRIKAYKYIKSYMHTSHPTTQISIATTTPHLLEIQKYTILLNASCKRSVKRGRFLHKYKASTRSKMDSTIESKGYTSVGKGVVEEVQKHNA